MGLVTLAVWRLSPGRPVLALGLTAVQATALAAWLLGPEKFGFETLPLLQITASVLGLLAVVSAESVARALRPRPVAVEPGCLSRPTGWVLSALAGIIIGFGGIICIERFFLPHSLPTTTYTGPMKTIRMGRIEFQVPLGDSEPGVTIRAIWPDGEVSMDEYIYNDGQSGSEQFAAGVNQASDTSSQERIQAEIAETTKEFASRLGLDEPGSLPAPTSTRTTRTVDDHFQSPARLVSGGARSELVLLVERPEGYLKFQYDPRKDLRPGSQPARSEMESEAWLIERARELLEVYTWTGRQADSDDGFRTAYGVLRPRDGANFSLDFLGFIFSKDPRFDLLLKSSKLHRYSYAQSFEDHKQQVFGYALRHIFDGQLDRTLFQSQSLAGVPGMVQVRLWRNWRAPADKSFLTAKWLKNSALSPGLAEIEMYCYQLDSEDDAAIKLGLWRAIIESVRYLDAPAEPETTPEAVRD